MVADVIEQLLQANGIVKAVILAHASESQAVDLAPPLQAAVILLAEASAAIENDNDRSTHSRLIEARGVLVASICAYCAEASGWDLHWPLATATRLIDDAIAQLERVSA